MKYLLLPVLAACMLLAACTSENSRKPGTFRRNPEVFHKLKDYSLQLSLLTTRRDFYAGDETAVLTFALKNTGLKQVTIYEWHTSEAANIKLFYRPGGADVQAPAESWKESPTFDPARTNLKARSPLSLNPGSNQALVQVPAAFLKELKNPTGKRIPYTIRAALNLYSVTVESEPIEIYIR
ncbi:MAG: hypothetical protein IJS14_15125 [Lentisphaeria bacterium]|nr:hypothetical protein [Lentisphaeria bacterium]